MNKTLNDFEGTEIQTGDTVKVRYSAVATGAHHRSILTGTITAIKPDGFVGSFGLVTVQITGASNRDLLHHVGSCMTVYSSHVIRN